MLARFSLYGFLKNQQYFEPFLALLLIDRGLGFAALGLLFGLRQFTRTVTEIPTGVLADLRGRRSVMVASMVSYIVAFAVFGLGSGFGWFALAMVGMGLGDALRTGTHKAMILQWLRGQGREDERTQVYGYTRSWSKLGSAASVIVGTALVLVGGRYEPALWLAMVPYVLNLVNLATYPAELDVSREVTTGVRDYVAAARDVFRATLRRPRLRRVVGESLAFASVRGLLNDYLQPILLTVALGIPLALEMDQTRRSAALIGLVYLALHLMSATASRNAHRVATAAGSDDAGARSLWVVLVALSALLTVSFALDLTVVGLAVAVAALVLHDLWRPILVSRLDAVSDPQTEATLFSVESQARGLVQAIAAPAIGLALDAVNAGLPASEWSFWPIAAFAMAVSLTALAIRPTN